MLPYSLVETDMPFCAFEKRGCLYCPAPYLNVPPETKMLVRSDAPSDQAENQAAAWPQDIFNVLERFDVRQVPYVPDAGHSQLIQRVLASKPCAVLR